MTTQVDQNELCGAPCPDTYTKHKDQYTSLVCCKPLGHKDRHAVNWPIIPEGSTTSDIDDGQSLLVRVFLEEFEAIRGVGPDGTGAKCPETGAPYQTIAWTKGGSCIRFERAGTALFDTPDLAWALWQVAFEAYARDRRGKVYWRMRPEMLTYAGRFAVVARLHIPENEDGSNSSD